MGLACCARREVHPALVCASQACGWFRTCSRVLCEVQLKQQVQVLDRTDARPHSRTIQYKLAHSPSARAVAVEPLTKRAFLFFPCAQVLLSVTQKALPALPISIGLGVFYYFLTRAMVVPYMQELVLHPVFV